MKKNETKGARIANTSAPVFDLPTVRLSADETRLILRVAQCGPTLRLNEYNALSLVELGILQKRVIKAGPQQSEIDAAWHEAQKAVREKRQYALNTATEKLKRLLNKKVEVAFVLTDLGKQLARGLSVRIASSR